MKIASFLLSGLVVAAMGFTATGCNENPSDPDPNTPGAPGAPRNIQATSLGTSSVGLKWDAPSDTGTITYSVSWKPASGTGSDSGTINNLTSTSYTFSSGLTANKAYTFSVYSVRSGRSSSATMITWAGAQRYSTDQATSTTIRMYETSSSSGSGLAINTPNGPHNVSVSASNPNPGSVNLAIYTSQDQPNSFDIGAAYAFIEYRNANNFDQNTFISDSAYPAQSLDTWFSTESIDNKITTSGTNSGNISYFRLPIAQTGGMGQGFYVRTGTAGAYNYARVFIKNVGGKLLQGTAPNRYIEIEVSYQLMPNTPYAKTAGYRPTPANMASRPGPVPAR